MDLISLINYVPIWQCIISFLFLLSINLLCLIYSKINWKIKSLLTVMSIFVVIMAYQSITNSFGWPYSGNLPDNFQILGVVVDEPFQGTGGGIYYTLQDMKLNQIKPRIYALPFSPQGQKQAAEIKKKLMQGQKVYGEAHDNKSAQDLLDKMMKAFKNGKDGDAEGNSTQGGGSYDEKTQADTRITLKDPNFTLPPKDGDSN